MMGAFDTMEADQRARWSNPCVHPAMTPSDYIASLPKGLDSYPQCKSRGALFTTYASCHAEVPLVFDDLRSLTGLDLDAISRTGWYSTVTLHVFELLIAGRIGMSTFLKCSERANTKMLESKLYRALTRVVSTSMLVRGAAGRWAHFHRNAPMHARIDGNAGQAYLAYPEKLYPECLALEKGLVIAAALTVSGVEDVAFRHRYQEHQSTFFYSWS